MTENAYAPPEANLLSEDVQASGFYVVARWKFILLSVLSFGLYFYYWSYKNWSLYKQRTQEESWPLARGLFYIFFVHRLFRQADKAIHDSGRKSDWDLEQWATVFVVLTLAAAVLEKLSGQFENLAYLAAYAVALLPVRAYVASEGQRLINLAANDPEGQSNNRLNVWNFLIIVPGLLLWAMVLLGLWVIFR
ncbi:MULTISPECIES: hypothetical protein [Pseudomonas]|jgi:hypothetical protein|uniref:DUF4234 domain-containing protein n=1 Tax=Pseudomonas fluorescens TaxID=294 RepID=A0AAE2A6R9_PSEFL|nr:MULTISPECIES: hypothetical protein [Pseudomonas]KIF59560.1 hypothetical protein QS95_15520 [Pseudomonas fluorescens]MBP4001804.1 hypothetical protein [Pseudomonas koreensis]POA39145.1 hypothetical protein C1891_06845 [Pseudomonas sp. GW456-12-1-14-TSB6]